MLHRCQANTAETAANRRKMFSALSCTGNRTKITQGSMLFGQNIHPSQDAVVFTLLVVCKVVFNLKRFSLFGASFGAVSGLH